MILLQAAIGAAIALVYLIGIAFLIGIPILTILISSYLSAKNKRTDLNESKKFSFSKQKNQRLTICL
jgi:Tfp pilus assembly protein PilW